jgi:hypothetical protein
MNASKNSTPKPDCNKLDTSPFGCQTQMSLPKPFDGSCVNMRTKLTYILKNEIHFFASWILCFQNEQLGCE